MSDLPTIKEILHSADGITNRAAITQEEEISILRSEIAALHAERDNWLREALKMATVHLKDPLLLSCLCEWCQLTRTLLSPIASGEPARKP